MFEVKNRNFIIDGRNTLLYGGEVHYFRLPVCDWEDRIVRAKEAGCNLVSTYVPWMIHEETDGDIDLVGRKKAENDLGLFVRLIAKHDMYCLLRPGPYVMSELIHEGIPAWMYTRYPDALARTRDGGVHPTQSFYLLDPAYLGRVSKWYEAFAETIRPYLHEHGGPILLLQLDNEIGMMHWCSGTPDYTPANILSFHRHLISQGMDLCQEDEFLRLVTAPSDKEAAFVRDRFSRYMRTYFRAYFEELQREMVRLVGEIPVVLNVHGFDGTDIIKRGKRYPIGVAQLSEAAKARNTVTAGDYYIGNICYDNCQDIVLANAFTEAVQSPDQPLFSAEFQGGFQFDTPRIQPTSYDLTTRLCIADGMNGVNFYMFAGGTNPPGTGYLGHRHNWQAPVNTDGTLRPQYPVIAHLGHVLRACNDSLAATHKETTVTLGLIPDYYMTEYRDTHTAAFCDELILYREEFLYEGMGKAMTLLNLSFGGLDLTATEPIDVGRHPALAVFATPYMDGPVQQKLVDYVGAGGRLLIFPTVPDRDMLGEPCTTLADLFGVCPRVVDFGFADIDGIKEAVIWSATDFGNIPDGFATSSTGFTCGFTKAIGKGTAVVFGMAMQHHFHYYDAIVLNTFRKIGVEPLYTTDRVEDKLLIQSRMDDRGGRYLFLNNIDEYDKTVHLYRDGVALFDNRTITVRARRGLILPYEIRFAEDLWIRYSTAEIIGYVRTDGGCQLTLALAQPEDVIVIRTGMKLLTSQDHRSEFCTDGTLRVTSLLHGALHDSLVLELTESQGL
jgi:beta-galactosidase